MKVNEICENISHTSKRLRDIERKKGVKPGTQEWFKLWFSLPYLKESTVLEGYKMKLERGKEMDVLHIVDTKTGKRTEVRGKPGYETGYDPECPLHQLLDKIGKAANISELMNGEVVSINPKHPDSDRATSATVSAFNEDAEVDLHGNAERGYVLSKISVPADQRGQGRGTEIMQQIVDRMDKEGAIIALTPDTVFGGAKGKLIDFYKRFGFVPNKGRNKDFRFRETMIRYPKQINEENIYDILEPEDCGPFDGGCVLVAQALQQIHGGDIVVLVNDKGIADHAAVKVGNTLIDYDGPLPADKFVKRFEKNELVNITGIRSMKPNDLPGATRNQSLVPKIVNLLSKKKKYKKVNEETGKEMLKIFRGMHHDAGMNKDMDAFIRSHDWELRDFTPDMFPSEEEFFDYDDPFDRIIDINYSHRVDLSQPIIVGPQYSDGKYSVIDGNHRAAAAQRAGKTIKGYFPVKKITEAEGLGLTIFDIDETLMRTTAQIKVVKDGKTVRSLTNQEFNNYELQPGEEFDFGEFRNAEKFARESEPIGPMIAKLKAILRNAGDSKVIMLTARSDFDDKETFLDTFRKLGIDMSRVHVHRAGNLPGNPAENKEVFIRQYLDTGKYSRIRLYDDSMGNIRMFNALAKEYPDVQFYPYLVNHDGSIKTVRESNPFTDARMNAIKAGKKEFKVKGKTYPVTGDTSDEEEAIANENFADGKKPGRKGLAKRMGVDCSKSTTELRKIAKNSSGEKQRMAHWCANMKSGKKK